MLIFKLVNETKLKDIKMTTAEIEERCPDKSLDGCYMCGNDNFIDIDGEYICAICNTPYSEDNLNETF